LKTNTLIKINLTSLFEKYLILLIASVAWLYWLILSLVTPVTFWDSNTYNIARLEIASRNGLFKNPTFNDPRQVYMSWSFDSVHLIFEKFNIANALPSFLCFSGILIIFYRLILYYYSLKIARLFILFIFSMPCLLYQATSTKPDIAVFYFLSCWYYALFLYKNNNSPKYIVFMCLSLAFAFGSKITSVPFVIIATIYTIMYIYIQRRNQLIYCSVVYITTFILFSSCETYINNYLKYDNLLGPPYYIKMTDDANLITRAIASCIRRLFDNTSLGYESFIHETRIKLVWENICHNIISILNLTDQGFVKVNFFTTSEASMRFIIDGSESNCDYGIIGSLSLWLSIILSAVFFIIKSKIKYFALAATCYFIILNGILGYGPWSNRYSLGAFVLSSAVLSIFIVALRSKFIYFLFCSIALVSIIATPIYSFNKSPSAIREYIKNRNVSQLYENPLIIPIYNDVHDYIMEKNINTLYIYAGTDSWILPFLQFKKIKIIIISDVKELVNKPNNKSEAILLVLNCTTPFNEKLMNFKFIKHYTGSWSTKESSIWSL